MDLHAHTAAGDDVAPSGGAPASGYPWSRRTSTLTSPALNPGSQFATPPASAMSPHDPEWARARERRPPPPPPSRGRRGSVLRVCSRAARAAHRRVRLHEPDPAPTTNTIPPLPHARLCRVSFLSSSPPLLLPTPPIPTSRRGGGRRTCVTPPMGRTIRDRPTPNTSTSHPWDVIDWHET